MDLNEVRVSQIMTTRTRMISIPLAAPWEEAVQLASESGHTRLPVWDRATDDVVGILHTRELLTKLAEALAIGQTAPPAQHDIRTLLRPPYFVPESMSVQKLLREFQRTHTHMAVVTDEFGSVSGLVTIEDALEEIVGEIADEHDEAFSDGIRMVTANSYEARKSESVRSTLEWESHFQRKPATKQSVALYSINADAFPKWVSELNRTAWRWRCWLPPGGESILCASNDCRAKPFHGRRTGTRNRHPHGALQRN